MVVVRRASAHRHHGVLSGRPACFGRGHERKPLLEHSHLLCQHPLQPAPHGFANQHDHIGRKLARLTQRVPHARQRAMDGVSQQLRQRHRCRPLPKRRWPGQQARERGEVNGPAEAFAGGALLFKVIGIDPQRAYQVVTVVLGEVAGLGALGE